MLGSAAFREDLSTVAMRREHVRCGQVIRIRNLRNGNRALGLVLDRGPFGCIALDGTRTVQTGTCIGRRTALIDLGAVIARELEATGFNRVRLRW